MNLFEATHGEIESCVREWRGSIHTRDCGGRLVPISVSRWAKIDSVEAKYASSIGEQEYEIFIALRAASVDFWAAGSLIHEGLLPAGAMRTFGPGEAVRVKVCSPCDFVRIRVENAPSNSVCELTYCNLVTNSFTQSTFVEHLARELARRIASDCKVNREFVTSAIFTILHHLAAVRLESLESQVSKSICALPKWRLRRVIEHIEANLHRAVGLSELAVCAGLSRMHFARQFRIATGTRPHEYVVRRRIERAQELMLASRKSLLEIALDVGFQSQTHFCSVFKRLCDETPRAWRTSQQEQNDVRRKIVRSRIELFAARV